ncbi:MAG: aminopeptidase N [Pseudomonadota bacterium]
MTDTQTSPQTVYLKDYTPPPYRIESLELRFALDESATEVTARMKLRASEGAVPLRLDGQELELLAIRIDGEEPGKDEYSIDEESLTLHRPPEQFELELVTRINPSANTALEGLYTSSGNFCTQCEAEGFRKITYYPDRPDVMTVFTTTIVADKAKYPVLLSNGNPIERGELDNGKHFVTWHDPHPKPCYLFALVAGDLACIEDSFTTMSGREVLLQLYVQHGNEDRTAHAMASLKKAMAWDERRYGREYDLDIYMIVAVDDFNMGAMENKGLNIFNSRFVLAKQETATDADFYGIESVIAHEYFHNWSGNRVTCRDWFQLSLKEGFTVFRDQQFSADMNSPAVQRISDVGMLRSHQFAEDAGPMAHPVRPDSYVEINNFYTLTVYEKGAELIRMLHTLLGEEGFRKGSDLYFERHDGQAVTCEDFVQAMADANDDDLTPFLNWYRQAGTPKVTAKREYHAGDNRLVLHFSQQTPPTPGQEKKQPVPIPIKIALLDEHGKHLPLSQGEGQVTEQTLLLEKAEQSFSFNNIPPGTVPSILRGFSAPVKLDFDYSDEELAFLMGNDTDPFNRWEAGQQLALRVLLQNYRTAERGEKPAAHCRLSAAFLKTLKNTELDRALVAEAITLPSESYVAEFIEAVDPVLLHQVHHALRSELATEHQALLQRIYDECNTDEAYSVDAESMGRRRLKNQCLHYLMLRPDNRVETQCLDQYRQGDNMTDVLASMTALCHTGNAHAGEVLEDFYRKWKGDNLVLDKWFGIQATAPRPDGFETIKSLAAHPDFQIKNPNRVRALVGAFAMRNPAVFHSGDGEPYAFLADFIMQLDALNPQVAARLLTPLTQWRRYDAARQERMRAQLQRILDCGKCSKDVYEVVSKSLD